MEEDFEFLDEKASCSPSSPRSPATGPRTPSPTDFELVDAQRVRKLDDTDILVQDDYFVADNKTINEDRQSSATEDSLSEDDFVPVRRSKRNKKSKTKTKKGLQALSDVKCKIPPKVKNRTTSGSIPKNIVKNKPLYSQILQGVATEKEIDLLRKSMLEDSIIETKDAVCEEAATVIHVPDTRAEPEVRSECEPEDSEIEVMQCSTSPEETVDELIARVSRENEDGGRMGTSVQISSPVDEQVVFSTVDTAEDSNAWKFSSIFGISSQIFDRDYFKPRKTEEQKQQQKAHYDNIKKLEQEQQQQQQQQQQLLQQQQQQQEEEKKEEEEDDDEVEVVEMGEEAEESEIEETEKKMADNEKSEESEDQITEKEDSEQEEEQEEEEEEEEEDSDEEEEEQEEEEQKEEEHNMITDPRFTKSVDDYGLRALFEERLVGDYDCNSLIAMKTSTLMLAVLCSVVFGVLFGNCLVSVFMPATYSGISINAPTDSLDVVDDKFIMVKVDPAPPLFNYSSIWFGQPNEENLRSIFNEFRRLQRDHLRLQDAYNELRENMQLEKQMKWYWRKQARKDVVSLNSVKYTLHDGLMKVSEPKQPTPSVKVADKCDEKPMTYDSTITNLTESLKNAQKASNYWRGMCGNDRRCMYNDRMSGMVNASKDCLQTVSFNQRIKIISKTLNNLKTSPQSFNLSMAERNSVDQVRGAWTRLKRQWREKRAATAAKEAARLNVNRFRKMFTMVKMAPKEEKKEQVVTKQQQQPISVDESEDLEIVSTNSSECEDQTSQSNDDTTGDYISVCIQSYGSRASNESTSCFNPYPVPFDVAKDDRQQLKWFKNKYEELLLLSEISKWRTKYEMKRARDQGKRQVEEVERKKDKEVQDLQVQKQFVEWELETAKQKLQQQKGKLASEKQKFEKLLGNLDRVLKTNEESMDVWKKYERERNQNRVEKLVKRVKKKERSKAKKKVEEAKKVLKKYIEGEMKRVDERRKMENRNEELKKKLRAKLKYYKSMYDQSVQERTQLRNTFNAAKTEAIVQKSFIQNLMSKIRDLKFYKEEYEKTIKQSEALKESFKEAKTESGIQRTIINNLLSKINDYRKKVRKADQEKQQSVSEFQRYLDSITTSHVSTKVETDFSEPRPEAEPSRDLSIRYAESELKFGQPMCEIIDDVMTIRHDNITILIATDGFDMSSEMGECVPPKPLPPKGLKAPLPPKGLKAPLPPRGVKAPLRPIPPPAMPPMSFFANLHKYNKKEKKQAKKAKSLQKRSAKLPAMFVGPASFPPAPYVSPTAILNKLRRTKAPQKYRSPLVQKIYELYKEDKDFEPLGPSLPRPPKSISMPPMPPKKVKKEPKSESRGPNTKKRVPKAVPRTQVIYLGNGEQELVLTAVESENGDIAVSGKPAAKK